MFIDGLWLSGMSIEVKRDDLPIPEAMKGKIKLELTPTQMTAVAVLLGFGMRNGNILMYNDDDLNRLILKDDRETFRTEYSSLSSGLKMNRRSVNVFKPLVDNSAQNEVKWEMNSRIVKPADCIELDEDDSEDDEDSPAFTDEELKNL